MAMLSGAIPETNLDIALPPLSLSGKPFRLTLILLSALVRCPALNPIKPQRPPLVCSPANSGIEASFYNPNIFLGCKPPIILKFSNLVILTNLKFKNFTSFFAG
jgi:hypothetical protein